MYCANPVWLIDHDPAALVVDLEGDLDQAAQRLADGGAALRACHKGEKAAAARPKQFPAARAGRHRCFVNIVDPAVADATGEAAFQHPGFVQHLAQTVHRLILVEQQVHRLIDHPPHREQLALVARDIADLLLGDIGGKA